MDVLKNFDFAIEMLGVLQAGIQGLTPPTVERTEHKHGNSGNEPDDKTPGKKIVGDMIIDKVVPILVGDVETWAAFALGATNLSAAYARDGFLLELSNGVVVARYVIEKVWCKKIESSVLDTRGDNSADIIRNSVWSVKDYYRIA